MELISIVVPIYNTEKQLQKCLDSLLCQTYENLEIILVNDGSKDNSLLICEMYSKMDNRVKVIDKENSGVSETRNMGIKKASGNYITFVDSDDYVSNRFIEILYQTIKKDNSDISICDYQLVDEDYNNIKDKRKSFPNYSKYDRTNAIKLLLADNNIKDYPWNKMYKARLFENIQYPKGHVMEDLGTTYKLFFSSKTIAITNKKLYYYLQRNGSILHNKSRKIYLDKYKFARERFYFLQKNIGFFKENVVSYFSLLLNTYPAFKQSDEKREVENEISMIINDYKPIIKEIRQVYIKYMIYRFNKKIYSIILNIKRNS